jgi:hypothetical protein
VAPREEPGHHAQTLTATGNSRSDSPDRQFRHCSGLVVPHPLQSDEQDYRTLLFGQLGDCAIKVANLNPRSLVRRERQRRAIALQFDASALARFPTGKGDMLIV